MAFLDNSGLSKLWTKIKEQLNSKANASHDHTSISGTASNITGVVDFAHGGTGRGSRDSGYSALISGGVYKGDLNNAANAGVYLFSTEETTNYPTYAGRTDTWARLEVTTSARDSGEVMQRVIYTTEGVEFTRLNVNGTTWSPWQPVVSGVVAHRQFVQHILSGADLNNYVTNGSYVSDWSENVVANLPPFFGGKGAFTLIVTGINTDSAYTNQILIATDNKHVYMRAQTNWEEPWIWSDWTQVITTNIGGDYYAQLQSPNNLLHSGNEFTFVPDGFTGNVYINYRTVGGGTGNINGYTFLKGNKADADAALAPIRAGNGRFTAIQCSNGLIAGGGFHVDTSTYGTSLPAAGSKGRVFFKKV